MERSQRQILNAAYTLVPPSLETSGSFRKDDENGNVNFKKRKL